MALCACEMAPNSARVLGTFEPNPDFEASSGVGAEARALGGRGLAAKIGEVWVLPGDARTVSTSTAGLGLRFDDEVDNLSEVVRHLLEVAEEPPGVLVLFTTFADVGSGGPAYYVPIHNGTEGTGLGLIDQSERFGATAIVGIANMKEPRAHGERLMTLLLHEIGHVHLAYADIESPDGPVSILGRQRAHWHAALHTEGSFLGGHGFRGQGDGRFVVIAREETYSPLDLHLLGLLPAEQVPETFFIANAKTESGAPIPPDAQLPSGQIVLGTPVPVRVSSIEARYGPRFPEPGSPPTLPVSFVLLTAPGETTSYFPVVELAEELDSMRFELEEAYGRATGGLGSLSTFGGRRRMDPDRVVRDQIGEGCDCRAGTSIRGRPSWRDLFAWLLVASAWRRATGSRGGGWIVGGFRRRCRERSCGRSRWCGSRPCREGRRPPR